ncbi:MAG TPA: ATP-binding cassette domain-containing protein [Phenylobacterium sp.]|jgi:ABC-type iron transport system FetAB ATPase subunit|nr:ATP-binding cassette domain-containing protein [Phenylobacterium sp.]
MAASDAPPRLRLRDLKSPLAGPFDLELAAGQAAAISGPSGSGKSLFLRMVADLDPNEGEVALDGAARAAMSPTDWRRRAPYVAAESGWWRDRVAEHFAPDRLAAAREIGARVGLADELFDGPVLRLSTGEKQRLAIIRALVLDPPALLLDEPTAPLDPDSTRQVEDVLRERLKGGLALVVVTHDERQAKRLDARHFLMRDRRMSPA